MPPTRFLRCALLATALALPASAHAAAAPYDLTYGVAGMRGTVTADVSLVRNAAGETPAVEVYGGTGTTIMALRPATPASTPAGRLRWRPGTGGAIAVPAMLRFAWTEYAGRADGTKRRCQGRSPKAERRRLVHVLSVQREGEVVRVRWAIPLPRLGRSGCVGAGKIPHAVAENTYPADQFDHQRVRFAISGSERSETGVAGGRTRSTVVTWNLSLTLVRLRG
jgi:hypothetical protein